MIISQNHRSATIRITQEFIDALREHRIFETRTGANANGPPQLPRYRWKIGDKLEFLKSCEIEPYVTFAEGGVLCAAGSFASIASVLPTTTKVGRYASIASGLKRQAFRHPIEAVSISSAVFNPYREMVHAYLQDMVSSGETVRFSSVPTPQPQGEPFEIGPDAWIGADVLITGGVKIGTGAVVASRSIITKDVPAYAIVGGGPARLLKWRFPEEIRERLEQSRWWDYELADLHRLYLAKPEQFLEEFESCKSELRIYQPKIFKPWSLVQKLEVQGKS